MCERRPAALAALCDEALAQNAILSIQQDISVCDAFQHPSHALEHRRLRPAARPGQKRHDRKKKAGGQLPEQGTFTTWSASQLFTS